MFVRKVQHAMLMALMKFIVKFSPAARYITFAGSGSARQLCQHIVRTGVRKVLVVTDKPLRDLGLMDKAIEGLHDADIDVVIYDGVLPNPTFAQVAEGAAILRKHGSEAVLAVGGGSSIDAAKIIAAAGTSDDDPTSWIGFGKVKHEIPVLYAIPTTAGTGSEATMGAVISDTKTHLKGVISGASLLPAATALDSELMLGLPAPITAATGMDALTHGIEAYIGTWERGDRRSDARIAIKLVFENLPTAYADGANTDARDGMAMGSYYAGLAINQVNVGNVHAIAHQLGGKYGIPHGLANAMVLPHVLEFCFAESKRELAELALLIGVGKAGQGEETLALGFVQAVRELGASVGIPEKSDLILPSDYDEICELAMAECGTYAVPLLLDKASVTSILQKITA